MSEKDSFHLQMKKALLALNSLILYRNILSDKAVSEFYDLLKAACDSVSLENVLSSYGTFYCTLKSLTPEMTFKDYLIEKVIYAENPFTLACETNFPSLPDKNLVNAAEHDLERIEFISNITFTEFRSFIFTAFTHEGYEKSLVSELPAWDPAQPEPEKAGFNSNSVKELKVHFHSFGWKKCIPELIHFYQQFGSGEFARHKCFTCEEINGKYQLNGIDQPDPVLLSDLIGYDQERTEVINNTLQFLQGYPANNVLLYGDRGTGKSSTVKAILNEYCSRGLRVIELPKSRLPDFPRIIRLLRNRKLKFILFVDDLAFEDKEESYTALKAVLEGGLEIRPQNVLIYATSNRRHLIKESFSERVGLQYGNAEDEVRAGDSIQEKLSLADRFGITVIFSSPDKFKYLSIVEGLAEQRGLKVDIEQLHKEALKWEMWYNGRSPRTARQFIDWLEGQLKFRSS